MNTTLLMIGALQAVAILVGLLKGKALSILLGPAQFGVMSTVDQIVLLFVSLGSLSLPFTATKFMSRSHSIGAGRFEATAASFFRALGMLSMLTAVAGYTVARWSPELFGAELLPYNRVLRLAMLGLPAAVLHALVINTLAAAQRPIAAAGFGLVLALVLAVAAVGGVRADGLVGLYLTAGIAATVVLIGSMRWLSRRVGVRLLGPHTDIVTELRGSPEVLSHAAYIYLAQATIAMAMLLSRSVVLSRLGASSVGLLQGSLSIALTVGAVLAPMSAFYLMPLVNRHMEAPRKMAAANNFAEKMLLLLFLGAMPVVLFPRLFLYGLYTPSFEGAAATLYLFVAWQCIFQTANIYQQVLIGLDDVRFMSVSAVTGFGMSTGLLFVLVPRTGLGGAGVALASGMLWYGLAAGVRLNHRHHLQVSRAVVVRAVIVGAAIVGAGLLFGGTQELSWLGLTQRAVYLAGSTSILWWSLQSSERQFIVSSPARLRIHWRSRGERGPSE